MWPDDSEVRARACRLYGSVWDFVPPGIERAQAWGSDWFRVSTPFLAERDGQLVAHAGVVDCQFAVDGKPRDVCAIHGVCVHPEYRGRGLAREVIEKAVADADRRGADTVVLWSEKTKLYEKFGFDPTREHVFVAPAPSSIPTEARRLDLGRGEDVTLLRGSLRTRTPVSGQIAAADDGWHFLIDLALWIEAASMSSREVLAVLPDQHAVMVFEMSGATLRLYDLVARRIPSIENLVGAAEQLSGTKIDRVEIYFTPDLLDVDASPHPHPDEDLLMVRGRPVQASERPFALSPLTRT